MLKRDSSSKNETLQFQNVNGKTLKNCSTLATSALGKIHQGKAMLICFMVETPIEIATCNPHHRCTIK